MRRAVRISLMVAVIVVAVPILGFVAIQLLVPSTIIIVHNASSSALTNVVITGNGFEERIPRLSPGETYTLSRHPRGETGIAVAFDVDNRHIDVPSQGYASAGLYTCKVEVSPDFQVSVRC